MQKKDVLQERLKLLEEIKKEIRYNYRLEADGLNKKIRFLKKKLDNNYK